jgi:hypothetical protein
MSLPNGFDRADGLSGRPGTPDAGLAVVDTPSGTVTPENIQIEEMPDSPDIERAEQATINKRFRMGWWESINRLTALGRGTILTDSFGNVTKVLSASVKHEKPGFGILSVTSEGVSFDSPPDDFQIVPVELGVHILKHPRYFYAFLGDGYGSTTEKINQMVIRMLQNYFENPSAAYRDALTKLLSDSLGIDGAVAQTPPQYDSEIGEFDGTTVTGTDMAKRAALEIIQKYWRGEETPYVIGYEIIWSSYYFRPPYLNPGGYVEDPIYEAAPQLPEYFWSPTYPPSSATIFDLLASINPQCYSSSGTPGGSVNISWLRKADELEHQRTWFKLNRRWIGSPIGFWDDQLYSVGNRPLTASDYLVTDTD